MSAYIQITTFCNMQCKHCCYACGPSGEHMTPETFKKALASTSGGICVGGGEPTCNPHLWDILDIAVDSGRRIWMTTNGKRALWAMKLAKMAREGKIRCGLSLDAWHDPIQSTVINTWKKDMNPIRYSAEYCYGVDGRFIQSISRQFHPVRAGRCDWGDRITCPCSNKPFIKPDGTVRKCGCSDAPVMGTVFDGHEFPKLGWSCHKGLPNPNSCGVGKLPKEIAR